MRIDRVRQWQWMAFGLVVGGITALLRGYVGQPLLNSYGESIEGQGIFEEALVTKVAGDFRFRAIKVHAARDPVNGEPIQIVRGAYWDGRTDDGPTPVWRPAYFVARMPYQPTLDLAQLAPAGTGDHVKAFGALKRPTALDFLQLLSKTYGIVYRHAWWDSYPQMTWFAACFVGIGIIWPIVANLLLFGRFTRPPVPEEKGISLPPPSNVPAPQSVGPTREESARLSEVTAALEVNLAGNAGHESAPSPPLEAPIAMLSSREADEPIALSANTDEKEFGADQDDYYPTERHHRRES